MAVTLTQLVAFLTVVRRGNVTPRSLDSRVTIRSPPDPSRSANVTNT